MTGTGKKAVEQYQNEKEGVKGDMVYPHPIYMNCIPHCDIFMDNGYTKEEMKLVRESRKILNEPELKVTATAVRVPVLGGHSESINVSFNNDIDLASVRNAIAVTGLVLLDVYSKHISNAFECTSKSHIFVGHLNRPLNQYDQYVDCRR